MTTPPIALDHSCAAIPIHFVPITDHLLLVMLRTAHGTTVATVVRGILFKAVQTLLMKRVRAAQKYLCGNLKSQQLSSHANSSWPIVVVGAHLVPLASEWLTAYWAFHRAVSPGLVPVHHVGNGIWIRSVTCSENVPSMSHVHQIAAGTIMKQACSPADGSDPLCFHERLPGTRHQVPRLRQ